MTKFGSADKLQIENNPYLGYRYKAIICRNGVIKHSNNTDCVDGVMKFVNRQITEQIIECVIVKIFSNHFDNCGKPVVDGNHWKLTLYKSDEVIQAVECWSTEDWLLNNTIKCIFECIEKCVLCDLGSAYIEELK